VTASGGADVGAFQATIPVGADIQFQTSVSELEVWGDCAPFTINWTGGDPDAWVTLSFVEGSDVFSGGFQFVNFAYRTPASKGTMTIRYPIPTRDGGNCNGAPKYRLHLVVEVEPDPSEVTTFSAPGLTLGGRAKWKYVHNFWPLVNLP